MLLVNCTPPCLPPPVFLLYPTPAVCQLHSPLSSVSSSILPITLAPLFPCPCQVTLGLLLVSYFLWSRYGRMEDPERQQLLEEIRARLADGSIADEYGNEGTPLRG